MGGGKGGSSTTYNQRPQTQQELDLLTAQKNSLNKQTQLADRMVGLSESNQKMWDSTYKPFEAVNLKNAITNANANMGKVDQNAYSSAKANLFSGVDSSFANSRNSLSSTLAQRGLANSGIATKAYTDLAGKRANTMASVNNQAYNQGVMTGDAQRQQKLSNLTGYAQLGRGMSGQAGNYLSGAAGAYGNVGSQAGGTATALGRLNNQYNSAQWNANAQQQAGKGAMTGSLVGAGASLGSASILASDRRLKDNITKVGKIQDINIYTWEWNDEGRKIAKDTPSIGVIAQEIQEEHPECVIEHDDGYLRVNYSELFQEVIDG